MSATCKDCGKPVHSTGATCPTCGMPGWSHDSPADTWACPGRGVHVQAVTNDESSNEEEKAA